MGRSGRGVSGREFRGIEGIWRLCECGMMVGSGRRLIAEIGDRFDSSGLWHV